MIAMFTCTAHSLVSTLESIATPYSVDLEGRQLEHEIQGEAIDVAQDGLIECSCLDLVERREVAINHYLAAAEQKNPLLDGYGGDLED